MKPWRLLERTLTPEGKELSLTERDGMYLVRVDSIELMSNRQRHSEEVFGEIGAKHASRKSQARVLIGGLGLGFTLRSALAHSQPDGHITVAEWSEAIVRWNQNPDFPFGHAELKDPRTELFQGDIVTAIEQGSWDAILLDVDNGPEALSRRGNRRLYDAAGLAKAQKALRPGGCYAVWAVEAVPSFAKAMEKSGLRVEVHTARAHTTSGGMRFLYFGYKS